MCMCEMKAQKRCLVFAKRQGERAWHTKKENRRKTKEEEEEEERPLETE